MARHSGRTRATLSLSRSVLFFFTSVLCGGNRIVADTEKMFTVPDVGKVATWEAEQAERNDSWKLERDARASGGAYLTPSRDEGAASISFTFESSEPVNLQVWPLLGPHSDQRPPRRFPYPLARRPGPDVIDWSCDSSDTDPYGYEWQQRATKILFFTSPELARVSALDPQTEKITASVQLGGFLSDLVVDRERDKLYVADAIGNRVIVLNCSDLSAVQEIRVPQMPWSLTLSGRTLFVGCCQGRQVVSLDTTTGAQLAQAMLPFKVSSVEVTKEAKPRVVARPLPVAFDLESLTEISADTERYAFRRRTIAEVGIQRTPNWKRFEVGGPHTLKISAFTDKGIVTRKVDTRSVTDVPVTQERISPADALRDTRGPDTLVVAKGRLFFTSPSTGRVGALDVGTEKLLPPIEVGGYVADIDADPKTGTVFVADAAGDQVVVIDAVNRSIKARVPVRSKPTAIELFVPPDWLKGCRTCLFIACQDAKQVLCIDPVSLKITWQADLPAEPALLSVQNPPDTDWWPLIPTDRLAIELRTRLGVALQPRALDPITLQEIGPAETEAALEPSSVRRRRTEAPVEAPGGKKVFSVDNKHTVRIALQDSRGTVREQRWVDTTEVTDPQQPVAPAPLTVADQAGAVVLSLDGGADYPSCRGIWMTPDQEQFQRAGSTEFWEWNAPHFSVPAGRHVLRVKALSPFTQLDAVCVKRALKGWADLKLTGSPPMRLAGPNAEAIPERYRTLFYDQEPVRFEVAVQNNLIESQSIEMDYQVTDYLDERIDSGQRIIALEGKSKRSEFIDLPLHATGTFTLSVVLRSPKGERKTECRFLRVPKLDHPRMLFRKEEMAAIEARIGQHRVLFQRYFAWLRGQCDRAGFLPAGLSISTFAPKLPASQRKLLPMQGAWRRYDLGWRMLAVQLGAMFAEDANQRQYFRTRIAEILRDARADSYCTFHYHGPFFPGAEAILFDMVAATPGEADESIKKLREFFYKNLGDMNVLPWTLASIEDPPTPKDREILWHIGEWLFNAERYFTTHMGKRGGQRWLNDRTGCYCPYAGYGYSFIYLRNILQEPQFQQRNLVTGFLTHTELVHPMRDNANMLGPVGPRGEPLKWLDSSLSRHPLEKHKYSWEGLLTKLEQTQIKREEIDKLLNYPDCACTSSPMAFVVPVGLALGWYDPSSPEVRLRDLPPTLLFDVEGDAIMRSNWASDATEVYFTCGVRDHVYRHQPTHLQIAKGGEFLLGTASSWGDDGNTDPGKTWGNVVVIEPSDWLRQWGENKRHPRAEEYCIFNRFSDEAFRYEARDQRLVGYTPAEGGFGGGLDLHGHTESVFVQEGEVVGYETWPDFDYVAGDATNAWPIGLAKEVYRQVVFVKPDMVVVYDRVTPGPKAQRSFWLAATGAHLTVQGKRFLTGSGDYRMCGDVILPAAATLVIYDPAQRNKYNTPPPFSVTRPWFLFDSATKKQKVLEIHPNASSGKTEYLIVMRLSRKRTGTDLRPDGTVKNVVDSQYAGAEFQSGGKTVRVRFRREGEVGGEIVTEAGGKTLRREFSRRIDDSYSHWSKDPRYHRWITDPAFAFIHADTK